MNIKIKKHLWCIKCKKNKKCTHYFQSSLIKQLLNKNAGDLTCAYVSIVEG